MNDRSNSIKCADDTQQITIHLPCRLAERVDKYASENGSTITNVVIEVLDQFLRCRQEYR
jgi:predicted DNA-binding protein